MHIYISPKAESQLGRLPYGDQERIRDKLIFYSEQIDPLVFAKFIGEKKYRFRIGNYRAIFIIEESIIHIGKIEWRDRAYE
jgi:mRNA-degrading endonuclease RelE of RelBE toxin-antitoxin system